MTSACEPVEPVDAPKGRTCKSAGCQSWTLGSWQWRGRASAYCEDCARARERAIGGDPEDPGDETKRLAWLDTETTGVNPREDRIVELAIVTGLRDEDRKAWRFNPGVPIPAEATAVHGITDSAVAPCALFRDRVDEVLDAIRGCDLGGFNVRSFDLPLLVAETERAGKELPLDGVRIVDLCQIFKHLHPRTLGAAVRHYLRRELVGAHSALADTEVLPHLLGRMLDVHPDLPRDVAGLHALCDTLGPYRTPVDDWFDRSGGEAVFRRGKHRGTTLARIARSDQGYLRWMVKADDIHPSVKAFVTTMKETRK